MHAVEATRSTLMLMIVGQMAVCAGIANRLTAAHGLLPGLPAGGDNGCHAGRPKELPHGGNGRDV